MKKKLPNVTLLGVDCVDINRLIQAASICTKDIEFGAVKLLTSLPSKHPNVIPIEPINSAEEYSGFCISKMDEHVETEYVLIFQYDGFILNPQAWDDNFLKYDYIGAPWIMNTFQLNTGYFPGDTPGSLVVGNGGFSLRSKKLLQKLSKMALQGEIETHHPEDVVICRTHRKSLEEGGFLFAPIDVAQRFSFESCGRPNNKWTGEFGFHGLQWTDISLWLSQNPGYDIDNTLVE